jgi:hypothetical protein
MHVAIRLSQEWDDDAPAIGLYVSIALRCYPVSRTAKTDLHSARTAQICKGGSEVARTSTFRSGEGNVLEVDLPESTADAPYEIIPCTFRPNVFSKFTLTVYGSEAAFDLRKK